MRCVCVCHLDQVWGILSVQGVFGELVSVRHPGVSKDLSSRQPPMRVDVQHPGHQVLNEGKGCIQDHTVRWKPFLLSIFITGIVNVCQIHTLASLETEFQYPPVSENLPLPIRAKISSGVSSGPLAKGVKLKSKILILESLPYLGKGGTRSLTGF